MVEHERLPVLTGWVDVSTARLLLALGHKVLAISAWQRGPTCVISALEHAEYPSGIGVGPQWHISVSRMGRRPKNTDVRAALRAFGLAGAEEDNHHPGVARHFWLPVDPAQRVGCECKQTEMTIVEPDGYRWTNPTDGPCRGCEIAPATEVPCRLHEVANG